MKLTHLERLLEHLKRAATLGGLPEHKNDAQLLIESILEQHFGQPISWSCLTSRGVSFSLLTGEKDDLCFEDFFTICEEQLRGVVTPHWQPAAQLPTPSSATLRLKMPDGSVIAGHRRDYVTSRDVADLGYTDTNGAAVSPVAWSY